MPAVPDTIAALATPRGVSAIALVRASGPRVPQLTRELLGGTLPAPRTAQRADYRDRAGAVVDDVLITFFAAPGSYTGEDLLEISCHGNPFIAQKILEDLLARDCRAAGPGEFTQRAFLNGQLDLSQAEAVMDLIHARSERALAAANQQLRGALGRRMDGLIRLCTSALAKIEAYIDFPEEDLPPEDAGRLRAEVEEVIGGTGRLLATSHYGEVLRSGIKTVILGEPNAGKSSLLNRLVGRERALVSPEPGTTRDYLEEAIAIGPHLLRLIDTAGLNAAPSVLEARGIEKTLEQGAEADLFLWVIDSTRPLPVLPRELAGRMTPANTLAVFNKVDLAPAAPTDFPHKFARVPVSALDGTGVEALHAAIVRLADAFQVDVGPEMVAVNARHAAALGTARACLEAARAKLLQNGPPELIASDLRSAIEAFGQIAGKVDNERVLDELFATFCIGK
ncbi:MAG TPA: tRNA uridine-5-carboxymethylaminomethyl(34) synthesis GTPase MnmE [Opitutaceae bacterium]|nr:tRNA uridine-5-carboxymethylaminomethyl(34) synthesis GTPase MnmE [Opitutaceae bacterium]